MQGPRKNEPPSVKPKDCDCSFPAARARNPTGHAMTCPAYVRIMARVEGDGDPWVYPVPREEPGDIGPIRSGSPGFGPLELGSGGVPFHGPYLTVEEAEARNRAAADQSANVVEDNSRRAQLPRVGTGEVSRAMREAEERAAMIVRGEDPGPIPGRPGQGSRERRWRG